jgi:hypothetical protein
MWAENFGGLPRSGATSEGGRPNGMPVASTSHQTLDVADAA